MRFGASSSPPGYPKGGLTETPELDRACLANTLFEQLVSRLRARVNVDPWIGKPRCGLRPAVINRHCLPESLHPGTSTRATFPRNIANP